MQDATETSSGTEAPGTTPGGPGASLGGAAVLLGISVGVAIVLALIATRVVRRLTLGARRAGAGDADPRTRLDPWFEAGRRLEPPDDARPGADS